MTPINFLIQKGLVGKFLNFTGTHTKRKYKTVICEISKVKLPNQVNILSKIKSLISSNGKAFLISKTALNLPFIHKEKGKFVYLVNNQVFRKLVFHVE